MRAGGIACHLNFIMIDHYKILPGNILGLILINKMTATGVSLLVMKQGVEIFLLPPLEQKVLQTEFAYLQYIFIITKLVERVHFLATQ